MGLLLVDGKLFLFRRLVFLIRMLGCDANGVVVFYARIWRLS